MSRRLLAAIRVEYERNGRRTLRPGKLRYLRRVVRRDRSVGRADVIAASFRLVNAVFDGWKVHCGPCR